MIITKTPFRVSFCGGGSDLPSFYREHGGCVISTSINKYMYIAIHPYFDPRKTILKYTKTEIVDELYKIEHPIFHCILNELNVDGVEITCTADIPSGTGLGSSSAFTVGLLNTIYSYLGKYRSKHKLATKACEVEIDKLNSPIGKQDQFASAIGGLNLIIFHRNDEVTHEPIIMSNKTKKQLEEELVLFYLGDTHSSNEILKEQNQNVHNKTNIDALKRISKMAKEMKKIIETNDLNVFGEILDEAWHLKRELATSVTNQYIDSIYDKAINAGALGGKLLGAGGGGFFLFYCKKEKQTRLNAALNLMRIPFRFEYDGTSLIYVGDKYWDD